MSLKVTRRIIDAVHEGALKDVEFEKVPHFNFHIPKTIPGVDSKILNPRNTWADKADYDVTLKKLAQSFAKNFQIYADKSSAEIRAANPQF
jgi:phosphoenolpyruvate carboxykinase (ATP)